MLEILVSRDMAALSGRMLEEAKSALIKRDRLLNILVPAQATFLTDRQIVEELQVSGFIHVRALTFEKLTAELLSSEGGRAKKTMGSEGLALMCADAINRNKDDLALIDLKKDPEVHRKTASFINALRQEGISRERTEELAGILGGTAGMKLSDTAKIYASLEERLKKTLAASDMELYAMGLMQKSESIRNSDFVVYGFDVFPKRRLQYIEELAKNTDLKLMLYGDENAVPVRRLTAMGVPFSLEYIPGKSERGDITVLADGLFAGARASDASPKPSHIRLYKTETRQSEVETAAAIILKYAKSHRMKDIALVMQNPNDYAGIIKDVFSRNGIPFFMGERRSLSESKTAAFIIAALQTAEAWRLEDALYLVRSGFLQASEAERASILRYAVEYGMKGYHFRRGFKRGEYGEAEAARAKAFFAVERLSQDMELARTAQEYCAALRDFISETMLAEKTAERAELFAENGLAEEAAFEKQVPEKIKEILSQTELLIGSELDAGGFTELLSSGFAAAGIATAPPMSDEVQVGSVTHSIFSGAGLVIIMGANDGVLPSANADMGQLLLQHETEMLCREEEFFPGTLSSDEQKLYIKRLIRSAKELVVSYNMQDGLPSYMIAQMRSIFPDMEIKGEELPVTINGGLAQMTRELRSALSGGEPELLPAYIKNKEAREKLTSMIPQVLSGNSPARLSREAARALYGGMKGSVSSIETYYSCPYKHFMDYGIRPQEIEAYEEDAANAGSYAHMAMETVTRDIIAAKENWAKLTDEELDGYIEKAAEAALSGHNRGIMKENKRYQYLAKRLKEELRYSAKAIREQIAGTKTLIQGSEIGFGFWNDFKIKTPLGEIAIRGKIDRLDVAEDGGEKYIRVVDYKTGSKDFDLTELFYGVDIQLMVYLLAVLNLSKYKNATPAGGFYFKINLPVVSPVNAEKDRQKKYRMSGFLLAERSAIDALDRGDKQLISMDLALGGYADRPIRSETGMTREELGEMLRYTRKLIADAAVKIYDGEIEIRPLMLEGRVPCRYCPYMAICRMDDGNCLAKVGYKMSKADIIGEIDR